MDDGLRQLEERIGGLLADRSTWKVLEAGCGSASHIGFKNGTMIVGIDISPKQLDLNDLLTEKIVGDLETYPLPPEAFDLVVCWDVLEHLPNPRKALENFFVTVNRGGIIILASPNVLTLRGLITKWSPHWFHVFYARYIAGYDWAGMPEGYPFPTYHRFVIAPAAIARLAKERSIDVVSAKTYGFDHPEQQHKILYALWRLADTVASIVSLGTLKTDNHAAFCIILQKPVSTNR
jgi:2-polyprenyl-3-methyl-5-hydroxy-6-metoxy-1,4-benzoquinol methylase